MSIRFVDTNILLEAYVRNGDRSKKCQELLESDQKLSTSILTIGEFEWVLRSFYELERQKIAQLLSSVLGLSSLEIPSTKTIVQALKVYKESTFDWTDCLNAALMISESQKEIYSYDKHFDKFPGIKRLEP